MKAPREGALVFCGCIVLSLLAFGRMIPAGFVNDDLVLIHSVSTKGPFGHFTVPPTDYLRPLVSLVFWVCWRLSGLSPIGYHLLNAVLHGVCGFAIWVLLGRVPAEKLAHWSSWRIVAAALFVVLPSHVEAVSWAAGVSDLGMAAFALLAVYFFVSERFWWAAAALAVSLCFKEIGVGVVIAAPPIAFALGKPVRLVAVRTVPLALLAIVYVAVRAWVVAGHASDATLAASTNPGKVAANAVLYPLRSLTGPVDLVALGKPFEENPFHFLAHWCKSNVISVSVLAVLALILGYLAVRQSRNLGMVGLFAALAFAFLVFAGPTLTLYVAPDSSQNERYLYLPSAFIVIGIAIFAASIRRQILSGLVVSVVTVLMVFSLCRSQSAWVRAASFARNVYSALAELPQAARGRGTAFVANAPDGLHGYPVAGDCLDDALQVLYPRSGLHIRQLARTNLASETASASYGDGTVSLAGALVGTLEQGTSSLTAEPRDANSFNITGAPGSDEILFLFSEGHFVAVPSDLFLVRG